MRALGCLPLLLLGCAPPPSTRPLGGEEWVREERLADRKPHGSSEPKLPEPVETEASAPAVAVTVAPQPIAPPPATVKPGDIEFKFEPLAKGTVVHVDTRVKLEATFGSENAVAEGSERMDVRILEASAERVREVEVLYVKSDSSFRYVGGNEQSTKSGKRYRVRFDTPPQVQLLDKGQGGDDDEDEDEDED
ncbi:MAG TPA: hypothetical protein VFQ35_11100, partial [Polyangiaceae bacterium]|nr:hypothetical protein [Polyangiaceae bacterium]